MSTVRNISRTGIGRLALFTDLANQLKKRPCLGHAAILITANFVSNKSMNKDR